MSELSELARQAGMTPGEYRRRLRAQMQKPARERGRLLARIEKGQEKRNRLILHSPGVAGDMRCRTCQALFDAPDWECDTCVMRVYQTMRRYGSGLTKGQVRELVKERVSAANEIVRRIEMEAFGQTLPRDEDNDKVLDQTENGSKVGIKVNLICKWDGCTNVVNSHKGLAGYCAVNQPEGRTHRELRMEDMRKGGSTIGRKGQKVAVGTPAKDAPVRVLKEPSLSQQIAVAIQNVKEAEHDVTNAETRLADNKEDLATLLDKVREEMNLQ